jgi:mRNA interferase MazF
MVVPRYVPEAGHIVKMDFDPRVGHEQGGWRPALVLSPSAYNRKTGLAILVPVTSQIKNYPFEVPLTPGMKTTGVLLSDAVKNADWHTRRIKFVESSPKEVIDAVLERLGFLLGLNQH